jgi:RNA polymerase sigma factor (sigma-70 family)
MPQESDKLLWNKVRSGNKDAYALIYEKYARRLFSYGAYFSVDEDLIKDCIQEVFARIYQNHDKLGETDNICFYLYCALKNELSLELRKRSKIYELNPELLVFSTNNNVEKQYIKDESTKLNREKVIKMLNALPARQREIIYYRYIEELPFDKICQLMNLNYQSAQNLIQRSIKKLRLITEVFIVICLCHFNII